MPARGRVWRCSRVATALAEGRCAQRGCQNSSFCRRVEVTGASLFGMSCISALVCLVLLRWVLTLRGLHWLHWSQTRRSDGVKRCCVFCSGSVTRLAYSGTTLVSYWLTRTSCVSLLVCLRPLASHLFAAAIRSLVGAPTKIRQYRRHGFPL